MRSISRVARVSAQRSVSFRKISVIAAFAAITLSAVAVYSSSSSAANLGTYIFGLVSNSGSAIPLAATSNPITFEAESAIEAADAPVVNGNLQAARSGHTATKLDNGGVLIVGGEATGSAEIYDALNNVSASTGTLNTPRSGHTATKLSDGRVLIAGGSGDASTEIYDPANGTFSAGPAMTTARSGHTATLLANGSVFIAGGGNDTAEIFDGTTFTAVSATMSASRTNASAVQMNDGRIFIAGGDGSNSAEIFDPASGSFSSVGNAMTLARARALLRVLPDGKVQIIGGNSDGSMEVYDPAIDTIGAYAHVVPESDPCAGLINYVLSAQTRSALIYSGGAGDLNRSGFTVTELGSSALLIGGSDGSGATSTVTSFGSSSATVTTDKLDYQPGDTATISGTGFAAGETVRVMIHEDPHTPQERGFDAVADASGNFTGTYSVQEYDLRMKFVVGARGLTSGNTAQTTFTDNKSLAITFAGTGTGTITFSNVTPNSPAVNGTVCDGTPSPCNVTTENNATGTMTVAADVGSTFTGWTSGTSGLTSTSPPCTGTNSPCNFSMGNNAQSITATFTANPATVTPATNGNAISADTAGGAYTTLTGPILSENGTAQIGNGGSSATIILNAPSGFVFDTGTVPAATTVVVGCVTGPCGTAGNNLNNQPIGTALSTTRTTTQITLTITAPTANGVRNSLTWQNLRVRPTSGIGPFTPVNITQSGTSVIVNGVSTPNWGTLTEVPGAANKLAFLHQPTNAAKDATITPAVTVRILDQFNNHITTSTRSVSLAIGSNPGGGTLSGGASIPAVAGVATFSSLAINNAGIGYTLVASSTTPGPALTTATSNTFDIAKLNQTITVTTPAPASAVFGTSFNVAATGGASGNPVVITTTGGCSGGGNGSAAITMTSGTTACNVFYNQAGNANYNAAPQVTSATTAAKATTSITVGSATGTYGGQVTLTATLTRSSAPTGVLSGKSVDFTLNGNSVGSNVTNGSGVASVTVFLTSNGLVGGTRINAGSFPTGVGASFTTDNDFTGNSDTDSLTVNQKSVTASVTASNKVYNGNNAATIATCTPAPLEVGDVVTCSAAGPNTFNNKNVGTAKPVNATNISLGGASQANYVLSSTSAATTADILTKGISATLVAANKMYDGNNVEPDGAMSCSFTGLIGADIPNVSCTPSAGTFNSPNVVGATAVNATVTIGGTEGGNYTLGADGSIQNSTSASASASITARTLTASIIGNPTKPYDGNTNATLTPANFSLATLVAGESFTVTKATGSYNDAIVALAVSVSTTLVAGDFTPGAGTLASNYNLPISASGAGSISQASSATVVTCPSNVTYTGAALTPCTVLVSGAGGLSLTPTSNYSNNINAGLATASYSFAGDANHTGSSDSKNFTIDPAASVTTVTCPTNVTYTGSPIEPCTYTVTGAGGLNILATAVPSAGYANNVIAGTASATFSYAGDSNHTSSSDSKNFTIDQAASVTTVTCPANQVYTGAAIEPCTYTVTGAGGLNILATAVPSANYTNNVNVGTASASYSYPGDANHTGSTDSKTFAITKAPTITTVTCSPSPHVYTGSAIEPCTASVSGPALNMSLTVNYSNNIDAGTATASAEYLESANYFGSSDSENFTIDQAPSVTTVTCSASEVYTGAPIEPCTVSVTGAGGLNLTPMPTYLNNTDVGTATASYTFAGDANHTGSSDSETFDITQAPTTTVIDCSPGSFVYTGSAIEPCTATVTGVNAFSQAVLVTYMNNTNVGTAKANASFGGNLNYAASTAAEVEFAITPAATSISVSPATGTYGGTVDLTATLTRTSDPAGPLSGKTVHFFLNENEVGNALTDLNGVALLEDVYLTSDGEVTGTRINAGTYTPLGVGASFTAELNYSGSNDNDTLVVNQKPVTPSVTATNKTYDASDTASVTCSVAAYVETGDTLTCEAAGPNTFSDANAANGKTVTARNISLGGSSEANYLLTSTEATTTANIFQAVADCSSIAGYTGIYDANPHVATGTCTGVDAGGAALGSTLDLGASFTDYPGGIANWSFVGGTNYTNQSGSVSITINKADALCTISGYTGIYDGNAYGATGSCTGVASETMPTIGSLNLGAQFTNVPGGTANWSFTGTNNYNNQAGSVAIVINKADAICTITGFSGVYNGNPHGATGQCTGVGGPSDILGGLVIASTTFTNVPGGLVHWTFTNSNYNDRSGDAAVTITKANANCVVNGYGPLPYDSNPHGATGQCTGVGGVSDVLNGLDLGAPFTNVPGGVAHWVFTDVTGNYNDQSGDVGIIINRADATISVIGYSDEYDGDTHGASGTATGVGGADLSSLFDFGETYRNVPGGPANWTFNAGYANNNYNSTSGSVDIIITAKNLTISGAVADDKVYDGNNIATANFTAASLVGVISPDIVTIDPTGYSATFDNENVGENKPVTVIGVTLGGVKAGNYTVSQPTGMTAKITKKSITIAGALAHDKPYDGNTNAAVSFPNSPEGLASEVSGDDVGFNAAGYTAHFADKNVGNWAVTVTGIALTGLDAGNYELIQPQGLMASITPASLTASIVGDPTRVYNGDIDASLTSGNFDIFGLAPGEDFNVNQTTGSYNDKDVVDAHTVTASFAALNFVPANVDTLSTNYSYPTSASGPGHITPATPTVSINFADAPSTLYNGLTHPATATVTGVPLEGILIIPTNGTVAITYLKSGNPSSEPVNAGSYSASAFFDSANTNYTDAASSANALLTIEKANAAVVVTPYHVDYDGDPHTATISSITGVNSESNATVGTVDVGATTHTNAGTYNDTWSFTGTANYNDQLNVPITNVIEKATTTTVVTFEPGPYVYRGTPFTATALTTGPAGPSIDPGILYSGDCTNVTVTGGCIASATYAETANYKTSTDSKSITITSAATTTVIDCSPSSFVYTGSAIELCAANVSGANLATTVSVIYGNNINVGTATADASYSGDANHTGSTASQVTFQIMPATTTTVVTCPPSVTYNGSAQTPCSASVSGAGGLSQGLTANYSNNTNAGTASAGASYPGDSNHTGSSDSKNFTINKAPTTTVVTCPVSVMYNGSPQTPCSVSVKRNGPPAVQIATPTPSYSANQNVGTATASYTFAGDANHLASAPASANFQIAQAPLTITALNKSKIFGSTVTFDMTTPSSDFTVATLLGSDSVSSVTMSSTGAPAAAFAGSHPILISAAVGSGLTNYNINYVQGTLVVGGYVFDGFKSPIENTTTNVIVWNKANGGQAIPTKWRLTLNGSPVSALSSFVALQSFEVNCNSGVSIDADNIPDEGVAPGSSDLQYQGDGNFHFNWKTPKSYNNQCRMMWVLFLDGSKSPFAYFKFK